MRGWTDDWKATIGWVMPGTVDKTYQDFFRMVPADINQIIYTTSWALKMLHPGRFDVEDFMGKRDRVIADVLQLQRYQAPDFFAVTGDLIQAAMGPRWTKELERSIEEATGKSATTAMTAVTETLEDMGVKKVAVGTLTGTTRMSISGATWKRRAWRSRPSPATTPTATGKSTLSGRTPPTRREKRSSWRCPERKQSTFPAPSGTGPRTPSKSWRRNSAVPVLTQFNPILHKALNALGCSGPVERFGRLLGGGKAQ